MKATRTWELILVFLLLIVVAGFSATTEGFLDFYNLSDSTFNYSEKALIALVMALVIIAGEIDISVAATVALTSVMMGLAKNAGAGVGVIVLVRRFMADFSLGEEQDSGKEDPHGND